MIRTLLLATMGQLDTITGATPLEIASTGQITLVVGPFNIPARFAEACLQTSIEVEAWMKI